MNIPCSQHPDCTTDPNAVLANLSSEAPDRQICIQLASGVYGIGRKNLGPGLAYGEQPCLSVCEGDVGADPFGCAFNTYMCAYNQSLVCQTNSGKSPPGGPGPGPGTIPPSGGSAGGSGPTNGVPPKPTPPVTPTPKPPGGGTNPSTGTTPGGVQIFGNHRTECSAKCPDGSPFTWVVASGFFLAHSQAQADAIAQNWACLQASQKKVCLSGSLPDACSLDPYSGSILVTGNNPPYVLTISSGSLPPGLSISQDPNNDLNFLVTGKPTAAGTYTFTATATDPNGNFISKTFSIHIFEITTTTLPDASFGVAYSATLAENGAALPFWSLSIGTLPNGLSLNSNTGVISGTVFDIKDQTFTVRMEDLISGISCTKQLSIHVIVPPLNYNNLSHAAPIYNNDPGGSSSLQLLSNSHFILSAFQVGPVAGPALQSGFSGGASMNYTGASQLCRLKLSVSSSDALNAIGQIVVLQNAVPVMTFNFPGSGTATFTVGPLLGGIISITYFVSATAGIGQSNAITVDAEMQPNF